MEDSPLNRDDLRRLQDYFRAHSDEADASIAQWALRCRSLISEVKRLNQRVDELSRESERIMGSANTGDTMVG